MTDSEATGREFWLHHQPAEVRKNVIHYILAPLNILCSLRHYMHLSTLNAPKLWWEGNLGKYLDDVIVIMISSYWKIFLENSSCRLKVIRENSEIVVSLYIKCYIKMTAPLDPRGNQGKYRNSSIIIKIYQNIGKYFLRAPLDPRGNQGKYRNIINIC